MCVISVDVLSKAVHNHDDSLTVLRSPLAGLLTLANLSLLLAFAWSQGLPPCPAETETRIVSSTDDAATLANSLNCSSGSFTVEWFGDVIVSKAMHITEGTLLNITGATTGAMADGNFVTQLFAVDSASSLHLTNMVLANGHAETGGAIRAVDEARVSFGGNMTFASNTASYGGAIYASSSTTVFWGGVETEPRDPYSSSYGDIFMTEGLSHVWWEERTVFINNSAMYGGGGIYLSESSDLNWSQSTTFTENTADRGGAIYSDASTITWHGDNTLFRYNKATFYGGAIMAEGSSSVSWDGETVFVGNWAGFEGGAVYVIDSSDVSWRSTTLFTANAAWLGGAIHANSSSVTWDSELTIFDSNYAFVTYGGAIMAKGSSDVSWGGVTAFMNNSAVFRGGAVFLNESALSWSGNTTFTENTAGYGGAIYANSSSVFWESNDTTFNGNNASGYYGGAIMAEGSSDVSWGGVTAFLNNPAVYRGGAVFLNESALSWSGMTTFMENTAGYGGAIYVNSSSVFWESNETTFHGNNASEYYGGAIMAEGSSGVSWDGVTAFVNNTASTSGGAVMIRRNSNVSWDGVTVFRNNYVTYWGGGLYVSDHANVSWTGKTTFFNNTALDGGGLKLFEYAIGEWKGTTTFEKNTAVYTGGGLDMSTNSRASCTGETNFTNNAANRGGAIFLWQSYISWAGKTTYIDNVAHTDGGAVYATIDSSVFSQGTTTFRNNTASAGNGGALGVYGFGSTDGSYVNMQGSTMFADNFALLNGGAVFSSANPQGQHYEGVVFHSNSAGVGGAVATFGTGNNNETEASKPTTFSRCHFTNNYATEAGGALESAFGQEEIISSGFVNNSADMGGALRLGGKTSIIACSFTSNVASSSGLAVAAVGSVEINDSSFDGNVFFCGEGEFLTTSEESSDTARYDSVCVGCPLWGGCHNCTMSEITSAPICTDALEHTTANGFGNTLGTLSIDEGYWRVTSTSDTILACYNPEACGGGQTGAETFCNDGYTGEYCSVCEKGYSSSLSTTCTRCTSSRRQWLVAVTVIAGIIVVCAMVVFLDYLVSSNFEQREAACIHQTILRRVPLQGFKSIIVVWQILTQFASVANVTYPGVYQAFLSGLNIINLDVGLVVSAGCLWSDIDFHDRLLVGTIWPLLVLGLLGMTHAIALPRNTAADSSVREGIRHKHLSAVIFLLFFVYSSVSSSVFRMFACDSLDDGEQYLRADYRIMCTDAKHRALQVYAGFMIAVYPVGIPLLFSVLLYRHRDVLSNSGEDKAAAQSIASLWAPYRPNAFFYEVVECARRIMLTGAVVFIYPNDTAQIAITIITSFFFFVVSEVLSPYESVSDTWVSRCGHFIIFFSMFDVLLLRVDVSQESSDSQKVLAGVLVAGHVVWIVAVVAEAIGLWFAVKQERRLVEEQHPSQRALRLPRVLIGREEAEIEAYVEARRVLGS